MSRHPVALLALVALLASAGCATLPAPAPAPASPPAAAPPAAAPVPTPAPPATPAAAVADTVPSADALAVLAGIPEPLAGESRPAPPPAAAAAGSEAADNGAQADVPVPARTPVLGERPLPDVSMPADQPSSAAPAAAAPPTPAAAPAVADTSCWRVQFAAWADRAKAEAYLAAARSQLGVPLAIERQGGLFKVRTAGCMDGAAADTLRRRAREAGFDGAFRFRGGKP